MIWKDPPVASVKFDVQEARPLMKMGVCKTKPNPIISYKTTICQNPVSDCLAHLQFRLAMRGERMDSFPLEKEKKYLSSRSSSFQY